jgi:hypothetical protein
MRNQWLAVKRLLRTILLGVLPLLFLATLSLGEEMRIFVPSYEGAELAKVREWEKTWVGKKIDKTNVDQVKDLLLEPHVRIIKDPMYMNAKEYWFVIVPYQEAKYSKGQMEMTEKYAPAKFDGDNLVDYGKIAGFPFPEPKSGIEVAYNYDAQSRGDSRWWYSKGCVVDPRTGFMRDAEMYRMAMFWTGRCFTPPYPVLPKNPKGFRKTYFQRMFVPEDLNGMGNLEVKFNDSKEDDEKWTYMPNFRRITRTSQTQRGDNMGSGERLNDDADGGWADHIDRNTYKLLGRKELLVARHSDPTQVTPYPKSCVLNGIQRERVKTFEIEVHYKQKGYTYSKQLWYIDPEVWIINTKMAWDEDGRLWRMHDEQWFPRKTVTGETAFVEASGFHWDVFGRNGQYTTSKEVKDVGKNFPASKFTINALQKDTY